jgi:hypothetical protein
MSKSKHVLLAGVAVHERDNPPSAEALAARAGVLPHDPLDDEPDDDSKPCDKCGEVIEVDCALCAECAGVDAELPPDPEGENERRAQEGGAILVHYEETSGEAPYGGISAEQLTDLHEQNLADMLCDLGHWCDRNGVDMQDAIRRAKMHYDAETGGEGMQFTAVAQ